MKEGLLLLPQTFFKTRQKLLSLIAALNERKQTKTHYRSVSQDMALHIRERLQESLRVAQGVRDKLEVVEKRVAELDANQHVRERWLLC